MKNHYPNILSANNKCYINTNAALCNNSKKEGLFVVKMNHIDSNYHVLISSIDEVVSTNNCEYELGYHKFLCSEHPNGNIFLCNYNAKPVHTIYYCAGPLSIKKELCVHPSEERIFINYTLTEEHLSCKLKIYPLLSYRSIEDIRRYNKNTAALVQKVSNGAKMKLAEEYPFTFLQCTNKVEYFHRPDWYFNVKYENDSFNGLKVLEDLYVPGYLEFTLESGKSVTLTCGLNEIETEKIAGEFELSKNHKKVGETNNNRKPQLVTVGN